MKSSRGVEIHSFRQNSERCQRRSNSSGCAAIPFRNGCSVVSMPTSYVGPRGHTEENKRTAQGQGSQHSISSRHTLQTANSGGCARSTIKSSAGRVPRCSDSSKNATRNSTMTNGGTKRDPCVGRTDMTYRRPRSGRSASTHGLYPEAKIPGTGAMTGDEPRVLCLSGLSDLSDLSAAGRTAKLPPSLLVLSDLSDLSGLISLRRFRGARMTSRGHQERPARFSPVGPLQRQGP